MNSLNSGTADDIRTPDKLVDGENDEIDGTHCWIAPILANFVRIKNFVEMNSKYEKNTQITLRSIEYLLFSIDQHLYQ